MPVTYIRKKLVYPVLSIWSIEVCLLALFKLDKPRSERIQFDLIGFDRRCSVSQLGHL